jgi:hypothetical protein
MARVSPTASTRGGASWQAATTDLPQSSYVRALAIDPVTPSTLYAGTSDHWVYKSLDGAGNWQAFNSGFLPDIGVNVLAINPLSPVTLYAGTDCCGAFGITQ